MSASYCYFFGPLTRLTFDQFGGVAVKSATSRRENVVSAIKWPLMESKWRMLSLPFRGYYLSTWQFQARLQEEVSRKETIAKLDLGLQHPKQLRGKSRGTKSSWPGRLTQRGHKRGDFRCHSQVRGYNTNQYQGFSGHGDAVMTKTDGGQPTTTPALLEHLAHLISEVPKLRETHGFCLSMGKRKGRPLSSWCHQTLLLRTAHLVPTWWWQQINNSSQGLSSKGGHRVSPGQACCCSVERRGRTSLLVTKPTNHQKWPKAYKPNSFKRKPSW